VFQLRRAGRTALAGIALTAVAVSASFTGAGAAFAAPQEELKKKQHFATERGVIADSYIVVLKDTAVRADAVDSSASALVKKYGGTVERTYKSALRGFAVKMNAAQAAKLAASPEVASVEQNRVVTADADTTQLNVPSWGLDRLDQIFAPLNKRFTYPNTASNVHAYVVDTGIRISHTEFGGRASYGYDFVDNDPVADDCAGHGTHVAGTIGGTNYGVAKEAALVGVRVLNCEGRGTDAGVIAGIDWVTANAVKPAVVNVSLGGSASSALDTAVERSIASGLTYAVAAGNDGIDACQQSPARTANAITVGATDEADFRAWFSNHGSCLDIFAPGHDIPSSVSDSDTAIEKYSGTSMASPHVAGAAALALSANPTWTPAQVRNFLVYGGTRRVVRNVATYAGTTDVMLRIGTGAVPQVTGLRSLVNGKNISVGATGATPVQPISAPATMGDQEKFTTAAAGTGYITFASWVNGKFLSVTNGGTGPLVANASAVTDAERFAPVVNGDGTVSLLSKLTNKYVTVPNNGNSPLTATADAILQAEKFIWASPTAVVVLRSHVNNKLVTTPNNGASALIPSSTVATPTNSEKFDMLDLGNDLVAFRSHANRRFVTSPGYDQQLTPNATTVGTPQQFIYYLWGDGTLSFQSWDNGGLLQAPNGGNSPLIAGSTANITPDGEFMFEVLKVG
jgi:subtilisin family serine protease